METKIHQIPSRNLGHVFEFKQYGTKGQILLTFPCSQGHFFDYENFGMIDVLKPLIEEEKIIVFCLDSRDNASWFHPQKNEQMGNIHRQFELCVIEEVLPHIRKVTQNNDKMLITGNSWGAYHALNFMLKFPKYFKGAICLSGVYRLSTLIGDYFDDLVYYNDILRYLPNLSDEAYLEPLKESFIILSHGNGKWEDHKNEAKEVADLLIQKQIPHLYEPWNEEWNHDWPTWKAQIVGYLKRFL